MRNHQLESRVRENRTHGSEGGEGDSPFLPLSAMYYWIPGQARNDAPKEVLLGDGISDVNLFHHD